MFLRAGLQQIELTKTLLTKADPERAVRIVLDKLARVDSSEQGLASVTFVLIGGIVGMVAEITRRIPPQTGAVK